MASYTPTALGSTSQLEVNSLIRSLGKSGESENTEVNLIYIFISGNSTSNEIFKGYFDISRNVARNKRYFMTLSLFPAYILYLCSQIKTCGSVCTFLWTFMTTWRFPEMGVYPQIIQNSTMIALKPIETHGFAGSHILRNHDSLLMGKPT